MPARLDTDVYKRSEAVELSALLPAALPWVAANSTARAHELKNPFFASSFDAIESLGFVSYDPYLCEPPYLTFVRILLTRLLPQTATRTTKATTTLRQSSREPSSLPATRPRASSCLLEAISSLFGPSSSPATLRCRRTTSVRLQALESGPRSPDFSSLAAWLSPTVILKA